MVLKLNEFEKNLVQEISMISGASELQVREILEFTFLRQIEQYIEESSFKIPFIGSCKVDYQGDDFVSGVKLARASLDLKPSSLLLRVIGEAEDGESAIIENLLQGKIKVALQATLEKD
jgi:hypothetical protein